MSTRDAANAGAFASLALASMARTHRQCRRNGGCFYDCEHDRLADERLPWDPAGAYGGWGGHEFHGTAPGADRTPVVFVHGNQRDACDWEGHAEFFREGGYRGDELWAITFEQASPRHAEMAGQLDSFVDRVCEHAGVDRVAIVAHSLGVTGARYWLDSYDRYDRVETFVGLAGANHGTLLGTLCAQVGLTRGSYRASHFIRADYDRYPDHPLAALNAGSETPGDVDYYTLRGTDDPLFAGCERSPALEGAVANVALPVDHEELRTASEARARVYRWVAGESVCDLGSLRRGA